MDLAKFETEVDERRFVLEHLDCCYELGEACTHPLTGEAVSNDEYDELRESFRSLAPDDGYFKDVAAAKVSSGGRKLQMNLASPSLDKIIVSEKDRETELRSWLTDRCSRLDYSAAVSFANAQDKFNISWKLDGAYTWLRYEAGILVAAGMKPNEEGFSEDVTKNVEFVAAVPQELTLKIDAVVIGEVMCYVSVFEEVNAELIKINQGKANPRNYAAGSLRQLDSEVTRARKLHFVAHGFVSDEAHPGTEKEREKLLRSLGFDPVPLAPFSFESLSTMEKSRDTLDFEVDGVVISVNDLEDQEQLGRHGDKTTGEPLGKIAYKFPDVVREVEVRELRWTVARTGRVTPCAVFDGIKLAGATINHCMLHNLDFVRREAVSAGAIIKVKRSGGVIPKCEGVVRHGSPLEVPAECPVCGHPTSSEKPEGGVEFLFCRNAGCAAQRVHHTLHFLWAFGVKGLGDATVLGLLSTEFDDFFVIRHPGDLFRLGLTHFRQSGLSQRQSLLAMSALWGHKSPHDCDDATLYDFLLGTVKQKIQVTPERLFASLGIPGVGEGFGERMIKHLGSLEAVREASVEALDDVPGVGEIVAIRTHDFLSSSAEVIDSLLKVVELRVEEKITGTLSGKTFCLSGTLPGKKRLWEEKIRAAGGEVVDGVKKDTNFLVAGPGSGSKTAAAVKYGVKIIDTCQLEKLLDE